jgi:hypothetical protein
MSILIPVSLLIAVLALAMIVGIYYHLKPVKVKTVHLEGICRSNSTDHMDQY